MTSQVETGGEGMCVVCQSIDQSVAYRPVKKRKLVEIWHNSTFSGAETLAVEENWRRSGGHAR